MPFTAVLFDFMGTTAAEKDPTMIHQCFIKAFRSHGVDVPDEIIKANRGRDKKEIVATVLQHHQQSQEAGAAILEAFNTLLKKNLDNFTANPETRPTVQFLKEKNIIRGLGTGFPRDVFDLIFDHLGWHDIGFDYTGIAEEIGQGRPHPGMIFDMMKKFQLPKEQFLKVGDTIADIQEGKNAGVKTVAILSGTQDENELIKQQPDFIIRQLSELKAIITV
jgi:HAD superfamily hydrolase (TIGR01549 family)